MKAREIIAEGVADYMLFIIMGVVGLGFGLIHACSPERLDGHMLRNDERGGYDVWVEHPSGDHAVHVFVPDTLEEEP